MRKKNTFKTKMGARKHARTLGLKGIHSHGKGQNKKYMARIPHAAKQSAMRNTKKRGQKKRIAFTQLIQMVMV